jgi:hypothetical protein
MWMWKNEDLIMKILFILFSFMFVGSVVAAEIKVGRFSDNDLSGWDEKPFSGRTFYSVVREGERTVLQARSNGAASGLVRKLQVDPADYPVLRWSWKIERTIDREEANRKSGEDFAARLYVVFPRLLFWKTRAINYVWSSRLPVGTALPSPYTRNSINVVVESGNGKAGAWVNETRNYREDYRRLFHEEPPPVGAIAVMTDTDNTLSAVTAWYGDITLHDR